MSSALMTLETNNINRVNRARSHTDDAKTSPKAGEILIKVNGTKKKMSNLWHLVGIYKAKWIMHNLYLITSLALGNG